MRFSTRFRYGARAALEIAQSYGNGYRKRKEIAVSQEISDSYLENILIGLKSAGIIEAVRGANGGYALKRPPSQTTLLDLLQALEGRIAPVDCAAQDGYCDRSSGCVMRRVYREFKAVQEGFLGSLTLQDLLDRRSRRSGSDYAI